MITSGRFSTLLRSCRLDEEVVREYPNRDLVGEKVQEWMFRVVGLDAGVE